MMNKYFDKALPIFPKDYIDEMNVSVLFMEDFSYQENVSLIIAGEIEYQIFLNGEFVGCGPAKAAHNYHRIGIYNFTNLSKNNRLVVILASYRVNTFDMVNKSPFIQYELKSGKNLIAYSNLNSKAYLYQPRYRKVTRFSYQRAFSESYNDSITNDIFNFNAEINFPKLELAVNEYGKLLDRNVNYPLLNDVIFSLKEKDDVYTDESVDIYQDRYMYNKGIGIFDKNEWEVDPNKIVSQLVHKKRELDNNVLSANQSLAYENIISVTGFIELDVDVLKDCELYIYFDEISTSKDMVDFKFYRNTSHNIVSYQLKKGHYRLLSFSPYTAKYIRATNLKGECVINNVSIVLLENPDSHNLKYEFDDKKLRLIFDAARNTFASNAVDILTDCPSRERAGWLCDGYFTGRAEKLFTGKNLVERNFLENYALYQYHGDVKKDMLPMCYPADFFNNEMYIPNWAMFYVIELQSYLLRNQDEELKNISIPNIKMLLRFFKKYENEYGLLEDLEDWVMIEWSHANDPESICGVNIPSNALYSAFLECAGVILNDESLVKKANKIKKEIKNRAFDGTFFVDNLVRDENNNLVRNNRICETTLYYLFYFDVINKEKYPELFNTMINDFGPNRDAKKIYPNIYESNVFIGDYLRIEILLKYGLCSKVLDETIDFFYKMAKATGTLWEHNFVHGSLNHGFASYTANAIFYALTGIYKIDYFDKIIYKRKVNQTMNYRFEVPLENGKLTFTNKGDLLVDGYKIMMEE